MIDIQRETKEMQKQRYWIDCQPVLYSPDQHRRCLTPADTDVVGTEV